MRVLPPQPSDSKSDALLVELIPIKNFGTRGQIRTDTVGVLNPLPPANWATRAYHLLERLHAPHQSLGPVRFNTTVIRQPGRKVN